MENHDHRLVTLLDLAGNTFRNEVVGAFQTDDRQLPPRQGIHGLFVHIQLLDLAVVNKLVGGVAFLAAQPIAFDQLADLPLNRPALRFLLALTVQFTIPGGLFFACLPGPFTGFIDRLRPLGLLLALFLLLFLFLFDSLGLFFVGQPLFQQLVLE